MAAAWPPVVSEDRDGWIFRFSSGVTRRANSVLVTGQPDDPAAVVASAEDFYRARSATPIFLLSELAAPASVSRFLNDAGYVRSTPTSMLWSSCADVLSALSAKSTFDEQISSDPTDDWFDVYWAADAGRHASADAASVVRAVLLRPTSQTLFVSVTEGDGVISVGQSVVRGGWACLQCLATAPAGRRRGAASQVVRRLVAKSAELGATNVFAAVMDDNDASLALFRRASFRRSHRYVYDEAAD